MNILRCKDVTKNDDLKNRVLAAALQLLNDYENDIETGIADGVYDEAENVETRKTIAANRILFEEFEKQQHEVLVYVEGGNIQGASATTDIIFTLYDKDNYDAGMSQEELKKFEEVHGTPKQWNAMIKERTASGEIIPVY